MLETKLNPKEEREYERFRKMGQRLHIPVPEVLITLEVFGKDGKLIQKHHQRSHSWVRNAYNFMFQNLAGKALDDVTFGAGLLSFKATSGATEYSNRPYVAGTYNDDLDNVGKGFRAASGIITSGILVGSGTNVESFEDYVLQTPIVEGTGANQLNHVESQPHAISYAALTLKNELVRYFNNNTVGETSVDVNEVCLVQSTYHTDGSVKILFSRDKLGATVTVPSTGQLKVTYTIQLTYPS